MSKEYIERKALLQDIVATVVFSTKTGERNSEIKGAKKVIGRIQGMPTADVVEVVRCKDCSFYEEIDYYPDGTKSVCRLLKRQMQADDFCSYGKRKESESNG